MKTSTKLLITLAILLVGCGGKNSTRTEVKQKESSNDRTFITGSSSASDSIAKLSIVAPGTPAWPTAVSGPVLGTVEQVVSMWEPVPLHGTADSVVVAFSYKYKSSQDGSSKYRYGEIGVFTWPKSSDSAGTLKCLTCGLKNAVNSNGDLLEFDRSFIFPGNGRLFVDTMFQSSNLDSKQCISTFYVLECSPNFLQCDPSKAKLLPVNGVCPSGLTQITTPILSRWGVLSEDGSKLVWENVLPVGGVTIPVQVLMMMGNLAKSVYGTSYTVSNPLVISGPFRNAQGQVLTPPLSNSDLLRPENINILGALMEPKRFCNGGKSLLFGSIMESPVNPDMYLLDLTSGNITKFLSTPTQDEDGGCSPNNQYVVLGTEQPQYAWLPPITTLLRPTFINLSLGVGANHYMFAQGNNPHWIGHSGGRSVMLYKQGKVSTYNPGIKISNGGNEGWFFTESFLQFGDDNSNIYWAEQKQNVCIIHCVDQNLRLVRATLTSPSNVANVTVSTPPTPFWAVPISKFPNSLKLLSANPTTKIIDNSDGSTTTSQTISDGKSGTAVITQTIGPKEVKPLLITTSITYNSFSWAGNVLNGSESSIVNMTTQNVSRQVIASNKGYISSKGLQEGTFAINANFCNGAASGLVSTSITSGLYSGPTLTAPWDSNLPSPNDTCPEP